MLSVDHIRHPQKRSKVSRIVRRFYVPPTLKLCVSVCHKGSEMALKALDVTKHSR